MPTLQAKPPCSGGGSEQARVLRLQGLGILCGFAAGAWLGAAEAPTKLVAMGTSPIVVSFMMVLGVFLARWTIPALLQGISGIRVDIGQAPHLVVWGVLAGCIWAVANTLTIFAIRNIGLSIAFPLWNSNSLLGIFWGFLLFNELRSAGARRWVGVVGGALAIFAGALLLALASSSQAPAGQAIRGVIGAVGAGVLWGTMYIPYRKAYISGMSPLSFVAFFTMGELGMMLALGLTYFGGLHPLLAQLAENKRILFWLILGGFLWVVGDIFQQYAAKYVGISRGIPLSNTNQLWGLLWGVLVFRELRGGSAQSYLQAIGGSLLMLLGAGAIALCSADANERSRWREAAERETRHYGLDPSYVQARFMGEKAVRGRTWFDLLLVGIASSIIVGFALLADIPQIEPRWGTMATLLAAMIVLAVTAGVGLWKMTRFS